MSSKLSATYRLVECLKINLESKWASIICLFIAFLNKVAIAGLYTDLEDDKSLYLLFAESALKGHLFLEPISFYDSQLREYVYNSSIYSPLYSFIAVPVLGVTHSFLTTSFIIDIVSWAVFLKGLYTAIRIVFEHRWMSNVILLCLGFFLYPHELASTPKDTLAIGLMLWGCSLTYKILKAPVPNLLLVSTTSIVFILLALTKYLYSPLAVVFVLLLYVSAVKSNSRKLFISAHVSSLLLVAFFLFTALFISYLKSHSSPLTFNDDGTVIKRGLFPDNLLRTFPFITAAFLNTNFWGVQLERMLRVPFESIIRYFQFFNLFFIIISPFTLIGFFRKGGTLPLLFRVFIVFSAAIVCLLVYMSLTHIVLDNSNSGPTYTYVQEARSYLFVMLTIQLLLFYAAFKCSLHPVFRAVVFTFFVLEGLHGLYFTTKQLIGRHQVMASIQSGSPNKRVVNQLSLLKKDHRDIALFTTENSLRRLAQVNGLKVFSLPYTCQKPAGTKVPAVVVVRKNGSSSTNTCLLNRPSGYSNAIPSFNIIFFNLQ